MSNGNGNGAKNPKADEVANALREYNIDLGDIGSAIKAQQVRRKLMNAGKPMLAQKFMQRWKARQD